MASFSLLPAALGGRRPLHFSIFLASFLTSF